MASLAVGDRNARQALGLGLIRAKQINRQQLGRQRRGWRRAGSRIVSTPCCLASATAAATVASGTSSCTSSASAAANAASCAHIGRREQGVGPADDGDRVLAGIFHADQGQAARRSRRGLDQPASTPLLAERRDELPAERVVPYAPDQGHVRPQRAAATA